ncbi:MAG: mannitol dehydrogenase family protein [Treponema sp.]|nr:mannitol dehydrogenase family protein [Treponema sp.]
MRLSDKGLRDGAAWERAGIALPKFDRAAMRAETARAPQWIHFGAGNIFRAFPSALAQELLEKGLLRTGAIAVSGRNGQAIDKGFAPFDDLSLLTILKADGSIERKVIASIARSIKIDDMAALREIFASAPLQMASFTITEKGYALRGADGDFFPDVARDMEAGPFFPRSYLGRIAALCHERWLRGAAPLALVSMDNCSRNGEALCACVCAFARAWTEKGLADKGFLDYALDSQRLSFPWTMIDKITPAPDPALLASLAEAGIEGIEAAAGNASPFVNAEETQCLIMEDSFPNGRPPLESAGAILTDRQTVDKAEKMKVCACLNPLHTALAIFGCLLGYKRISDEMKNPDLARMAERLGYEEGLVAIEDPRVINPRDFLEAVLRERLPNPFLPDSPQRIATDTSQKVGIRFGQTIRVHVERPDLSADSLRMIPLAIAAWLRYLLALDDEGRPFQPSPDPLYENLRARLAGIALGDSPPKGGALKPILRDEKIFSIDLCRAGLSGKIEKIFKEMLEGPGAVARALKKYAGGTE